MGDDPCRRIFDNLYEGVCLVDPDRRIACRKSGAGRIMLASRTAGRNRVTIGDLPEPG